MLIPISFAALIASNAAIIPTTVPVKPSIGEMVITAFNHIIFFSKKKLEKKKLFKSIGFAFSFQKTKHLPIEIFDKSLNMVITDKKIYK